MKTELIKSDEIELQNTIFTVVSTNINADSFLLFNKIIKNIDTPDFDSVLKILELIKINKLALTQ